MDEARLIGMLERLTPPGLAAAEERAALASRAGVGASTDDAGLGSQSGIRRRPARRMALAAALPVVLAAVLTPVGQAAVDWVGHQVGIGRPGGQPTLETLRRSWHAGEAGAQAPAFVLADGPEPRGGHYELVTYRQPGDEAPCFEIDLTAARGGFGLGCEPLAGALQATWGGNAAPDQAMRYVAGRVSADVDSVKVEFDGKAVPVELTPVPKSLTDRLGIEAPFKLFIGFTDDATSPAGSTSPPRTPKAARSHANRSKSLPRRRSAARRSNASRANPALTDWQV